MKQGKYNRMRAPVREGEPLLIPEHHNQSGVLEKALITALDNAMVRHWGSDCECCAALRHAITFWFAEHASSRKIG